MGRYAALISISIYTVIADLSSLAAYYNAGSSALVLFLVFIVIATFVWCRVRRRRLQLPVTRTEEEAIPLNTSRRFEEEEEEEGGYEQRKGKQRKGKQRATEPPQPPIFNVGDSDDEDDRLHKRNTEVV